MCTLGPLDIQKPTGPKHSASVIFFHGSGSNGRAVKEWISTIADNYMFPHIKILYPTAPSQPYAPNRGYHSNVWFDRVDVSPNVSERVETISVIKSEILHLIYRENERGIPNNRIIVGGYSMGGCIAMHTAFRWAKDLAGVFAFGSFLNYDSAVYEELHTNSQSGQNSQYPPLLQLHGDSDDLVDEVWARNTFCKLRSLGVDGDYVLLEELAHSMNTTGINAVMEWIVNKLPPV